MPPTIHSSTLPAVADQPQPYAGHPTWLWLCMLGIILSFMLLARPQSARSSGTPLPGSRPAWPQHLEAN